MIDDFHEDVLAGCFPGHSAGRRWLQECADRYFEGWLKSKEGKRWKSRSGRDRGSPYTCGFHLPEWHSVAIDALNKNDEEKFKAIRMVESMYL